MRLADINGDGKDDLCARAGVGVLCWPSTGRGFGEPISGPAWSNDSGFVTAKYYGTLRFGDINGDGKDDACIRHKDAYVCAPSTGEGFGAPIKVADWSNIAGWDALRAWATIRLADVNGDGKDDVCGIIGGALGCVISRGDAFEPWAQVAALPDAEGWDAQGRWSTLRVGDINDDGRDDLCIRSDVGLRCWAWDGAAYAAIDGPEWSDARGFNEASKNAPLRMGDINGDGKDDLCTRAHAGWICHTSLGGSFSVEQVPMLDEFKTASGWDAAQHFSTIQLGGPRCAPERCNGRDDDCDGVPDDDPAEAAQMCDPGTGDPCELGLTTCEGGVVRCEPMRAQRPDCLIPPDMGGGEPDMGGAADMFDGPDEGGPARPSVAAQGELGCACEVAPAGAAPSAGWLLLLGALCAARRRRAFGASKV
jgi:MYXO-CTERM domain-containing protein